MMARSPRAPVFRSIARNAIALRAASVTSRVTCSHNNATFTRCIMLSGQSTAQLKLHSYIARYPALGNVQGALHFISWQTSSRQFDFSGKHSAMPQLLRETIYSHIQCCLQPGTHATQRIEATRSERNCPSFETAARGFEPGFS